MPQLQPQRSACLVTVVLLVATLLVLQPTRLSTPVSAGEVCSETNICVKAPPNQSTRFSIDIGDGSGFKVGDDVICGGGGNDRVSGGGGDDTLRGGPGNDKLGGGGDDTLLDEAGDDVLHGGRGTDVCGDPSGSNTIKACEATPPAIVTPGRPVAGHHSTGHAVGPDDGRADQSGGQPAEPPLALALLGVTAFCLARRAPVR